MTALHTSAGVNGFIANALRGAAAARQEPEEHPDVAADVSAAYFALPAVLRPFAVDALRAHAAGAGDPWERVDALRVLEWVVGS